MANRYSDFPSSLDILKKIPEFRNLTEQDKTNQTRYLELVAKGNSLTEAELTELEDLLYNQLRPVQITPVDWNTVVNAVMTSQDYFLNTILPDISDMVNAKETEFTNLVDTKTDEFNNVVTTKTSEFQAEIDEFADKGIYNPTTQYYTKNFVTYNDGTGDDTYLCIQDSLGNIPTNTTYFRKMGIRGQKGENGVGLSYRGSWNNTTTYAINDAVQYGGKLFGCLQANTGQEPNLNADTTFWAKALDVNITTTELIGVRSITSSVSNVNFITGEITAFNPNTDSLAVYINTTRKTKGYDYVINENNQSIDKVSGSWDGTIENPIFFEFVATRNMVNGLVFSDGQSIADGTVSKNKLTTDVQNTLDKVQTNETNITSNLNKIEILSTQELESTGYGVISGLTILAQEVPDMTVNVAGGIVHMPNGVRLAPTGNSALVITTADVTNPRIDIVYVNSDSTIGYLEGIPNTTPTAPTMTDGTFLLAEIYIGANITSITNDNITDKRKIKVTTEGLKSSVDEQLAEMATEIEIKAEKDGTLQTNLNSEKLNSKTATATPLTTEKTDLIGMVNEIFTNANNGKQNWVDVIGSPLLNTDTFATLMSKTQTLKDTFATNLTNKGQSSVGTEALTSLIGKIANINTGKKFAIGTTSVNYWGYVAVNGLAFTPSIVLAKDIGLPYENSAFTIYLKNFLGLGYSLSVFTENSSNVSSAWVTSTHTINGNSFSLDTANNTENGATYKWIAIE